MKKVLLIIGIVIVVLLGALLTAPFLFKDEIKELVIKEANKQLNAKISLGDVQLSFIRNFPNASVRLKDFSIIGKNEFAKDTLIAVEGLNLVVDIKSFLSESEEGYIVKQLIITKPSIYAHVLKNGKENWDIMKPDTAKTTTPEDTTTTAFKLSLKKLAIEKADIVYNDEQSKMFVRVKNFNHTLSGDMTADNTVFSTENSIEQLSFLMDNIPYLNKAKFVLNADIDADLKESVFKISQNKIELNAIKLSLDGWLKMLEDGFDMDLKLNAPDTEFKDILSLIPAIYAKDFADIQTKGKVKLNAYAKGIYNEKRFPAFGLNMQVSNAWFKYPALPKSVDNINIDLKVANPGGSLDATQVDVKKFAFALGGNPFSGSLKLKTPMSDPDIDFYAKGIINLGMIKEVYPLEDMSLSGIVNVDLKLAGKMSYYDKAQYDKFMFSGMVNLSNMVFQTTALPQDVEVKKVTLTFNPKTVDLPALNVKIGKSDINGYGRLENFIPYIFKDETLKGSLDVNSTYLNVNDFMATEVAAESSTPAKKIEEETPAEAASIVLIPSNLNFTLNSSFKKVIYDKMDISNLKGTLQIVDSKLYFRGIGMDAMGGNLQLDGLYNTQDPAKPIFQVDQLKINNVIFTEIYKQVDAVKQLAPIFEKTSGKFSTNLTMTTALNQDMSPDLNSLTAKGTLSSQNLSIKDVKLLQTIGTVLNRNELKNPTINNVSIPFEIEKGRVYTNPFDINIADTKLMVQRGSTGIDQTIDYVMNADVPTPENTIVKLNKLGLRITGTLTNPKVKIETKEMVQDAVNTLKQQAAKGMEQTKEVAKQQIEEIKTQTKENINTELKKAGQDLKESSKDALKNLFKK
jgi:hypothetical protein